MGTLFSSGRHAVHEADAIEFCFEQGWTDGLPVVPPTADREQAMLDACNGEKIVPTVLNAVDVPPDGLKIPASIAAESEHLGLYIVGRLSDRAFIVARGNHVIVHILKYVGKEERRRVLEH